jgi:monoterpene epsilon-lactone hydrolase
VVAGDSAGGGLALGLLVALRDADAALPGAGVCMSPSTDLGKTLPSILGNADKDPVNTPAVSAALAELYLGPDGDPTAPLASTLHADLTGLPPLLVLVGTWEILLDDSVRFAEKAAAAGVDVTLELWEEMGHIWPYFGGEFPEAQSAVEQMGAWVRQRLPGS